MSENGIPNTCHQTCPYRHKSVCLICGMYRSGRISKCERCGNPMQWEEIPPRGGARCER